MSKKAWIVTLVGLVGLLTLAACGRGPSATPTPSPTPPLEGVALGQALYVSKGCAACHGPNAEGTQSGPALPGDTREEIVRQVREASGPMPTFSTAQLSDQELEAIVQYLTSLAPAAGVEYAMVSPLAAHIELGVLALNGGNIDDARHHLQDILDIVGLSPEQLAQMEELVGLLEEGQAEEALHQMEDILLGQSGVEGKTAAQLHLELAFHSLEEGAIAHAEHHVYHFIEVAPQEEKTEGQEILELLEKGEFHSAEHEIEHLLGIKTHS